MLVTLLFLVSLLLTLAIFVIFAANLFSYVTLWSLIDCLFCGGAHFCCEAFLLLPVLLFSDSVILVLAGFVSNYVLA
mgnify:CR=1 FL=1